MDFYVTLPSNVKSFPDNTIANYKTQLPTRLILNDEYEVGLVEISYTLSWYNNPIEEEITLVYWDEGKSKRITENINLPPARYDSILDILNVINTKFTEFKTISFDEAPTMSVEDRDRIVMITQGVLNNKRVFVELSDNLCGMLGFTKQKMNRYYGEELLKYAQIENENIKQGNLQFSYDNPTKSELTYRAERPYEISGGFHSLFVYTDIIAPSFVGDTNVPLLRVVQIPTNAKYGEQILIDYPNTYYKPLFIKEFDTITINIKDDTGKDIPFEFGRCYIVLHFRKVNKKYFYV